MNRLSLTLGLAAMELCWIFPWSLLLGLWSGGQLQPLLSAPSVFGMVFLGAVTTQAYGRLAAARRGVRLLMAGLGAGAAAVAVRLDHYPAGGVVDWVGPFLAALALAIGQLSVQVLAFGLAVYLWWRGARLGAQHPGYADVEGVFRWGIGLLVGFGLIMALTTRPSLLPSLEAETTPFVVGFFFASLLTLALGRLESLRTRTRSLALNTQWFGVLVVVAGLVVLVALMLGQLVSFNVLIAATRPVFDVLGQVVLLLLYAVVIPLAYVLEWLIYLILSLIHFNADQQPPQPPQPSDVDNMLQRLLSQLISPEVLVVLKAVGAAGLLLVALLIVARAVERWRPSTADAAVTNEERDSVFDADRFMRACLDWLRRVFARRPTGGDRDGEAAPRPVVVASEPSLSVRALYRQVLRLGESVGARRAIATTAWEHLPTLEQSLEPADGLARVTDAYVMARYAGVDPTPGELADLQDRVTGLHPIF
jgi:Domain of unknown function (DUF4129)